MTRLLRAPGPTAAARMLLARHRSVVAGGSAAVAVLAGLATLAPGPGATVPVVTATRDLRWGAALSADDLVVTRLPAAAVPQGALRSLATARGRLLASPVRRGEAITDVRLVGPDLLSATQSGLVAVAVRVADAGITSVLRTGSVVDVLAAGSADDFEAAPIGGAAEVVAGAVRVLAVPGGQSATGGGTLDGALVLVAATEAQAARLAAASANRRLSLVLRPDNLIAP